MIRVLQCLSDLEPDTVPVPVDEIADQLIGDDPTSAMKFFDPTATDATPAARISRATVQALVLDSLRLEDQAADCLKQALRETETHAAAQVLLRNLLALILSFDPSTRGDAARVAVSMREIDDDALTTPLRCIKFGTVTWALGILGRDEEAVATGRAAAALAQQADLLGEQAIALRNTAWPLGQLGRHEEAVETGRAAAALAEQAGDLREQATALRFTAWSLGQLGRHEEAVGTGRAAAALAQQIGDTTERTFALADTAWSLHQLGRHEEAIETSVTSFDLAIPVASGFEARAAALVALFSADQVADPRPLDLFRRWVDWADAQEETEFGNWPDFLDNLFAAATRARAWAALDGIVDDVVQRLDEPLNLYWTVVGTAIATTARAEGRAAGFEAAQGVLPRLRGFLERTGSDLGYWLSDVVTGFAEDCTDPGLLGDVAGLLTADLADDAPRQGALLEALATVDGADDPERPLARMDPDVALWIRRIRNLPEPEQKPKSRTAKSKAGKRRRG